MSIFNRMKKKKEADMQAEVDGSAYQHMKEQAQPQPMQQPVQPVQQVHQQTVKQTEAMPPRTYPDGTPAQQRDLPMYPQQPVGVQEPPPIQNPQAQRGGVFDKLMHKEIQEEIVELSDEEKYEFVNVLLDKYRGLQKDIDTVLMALEDKKLKEKKILENTYRKQLDEVDKRFEAEKKVVEAKYEPTLTRYRKLADKFKIGGIHHENKSRELSRPRIENQGQYREQYTEPQHWSPGTMPGPEIDESYLSKENPHSPEISNLLRNIDRKYNL